MGGRFIESLSVNHISPVRCFSISTKNCWLQRSAPVDRMALLKTWYIYIYISRSHSRDHRRLTGALELHWARPAAVPGNVARDMASICPVHCRFGEHGFLVPLLAGCRRGQQIYSSDGQQRWKYSSNKRSSIRTCHITGMKSARSHYWAFGYTELLGRVRVQLI